MAWPAAGAGPCKQIRAALRGRRKEAGAFRLQHASLFEELCNSPVTPVFVFPNCPRQQVSQRQNSSFADRATPGRPTDACLKARTLFMEGTLHSLCNLASRLQACTVAFCCHRDMELPLAVNPLIEMC